MAEVTQVFNNYGSGAIIANNDGVMIINSGDKIKNPKISINTEKSASSASSQCARCKHGEIVMSGPHEGTGMYVKCKRPKRAIIINGGNITCDAFVNKSDVKTNK